MTSKVGKIYIMPQKLKNVYLIYHELLPNQFRIDFHVFDLIFQDFNFLSTILTFSIKFICFVSPWAMWGLMVHQSWIPSFWFIIMISDCSLKCGFTKLTTETKKGLIMDTYFSFKPNTQSQNDVWIYHSMQKDISAFK